MNILTSDAAEGRSSFSSSLFWSSEASSQRPSGEERAPASGDNQDLVVRLRRDEAAKRDLLHWSSEASSQRPSGEERAPASGDNENE